MLHAVLIGVDKYSDPSIPNLGFAAEDATELTELCRNSRFVDEIAIYPLINEDATRNSILHLIGTTLASRAQKHDTVWIFFAGHGSPETVGGITTASRFLACHDTKRDELFTSGIDISADLARVAQRLPSDLIIFMIDACFSGYSGGRGFPGPAYETYRREHRSGLRLADLDLGSGVVYLSAATDNEVAQESGRLAHGVFSYYLCEQLGGTGTNDTIGLAALYDNLYEKVNSFSGGSQHPVMWGNVVGARIPLLGRSDS
jgi:uncharacterized caspase-like protein